MANYNKAILMGNLTRAPELRYVGERETAVANFGLAVNKRFTSRGEQREETTFVDIEVWARTAEVCEQYLDKGSLALIEGELKLDRWENDDGEKRSKLKVRAYNVQFLNTAPAGGSGGKSEDDRLAEDVPF